MKLVVHELGTGGSLEQEITASEDLFLNAIRLHVYTHATAALPVGGLQIQLLDSSKRLISTGTLNASDLASEQSGITFPYYAHKYMRFDIDTPLKSGSSYWVRLVGTGGYSFSESAYYGWCKDDPDFRKVSPDYTPSAGSNAPLDIELWTRKRVVRGF